MAIEDVLLPDEDRKAEAMLLDGSSELQIFFLPERLQISLEGFKAVEWKGLRSLASDPNGLASHEKSDPGGIRSGPAAIACPLPYEIGRPMSSTFLQTCAKDQDFRPFGPLIVLSKADEKCHFFGIFGLEVPHNPLKPLI